MLVSAAVADPCLDDCPDPFPILDRVEVEYFGVLPYFAKPKGGPILVRHCDEGWRLHQPADCGKVVPRKWHAAVWTANLADCASPPDEREGTMITSTAPQERQAIRLDDAELNKELLRMTDAYKDELFPLTPVEAGRVVFPSSRLVCDVERFPSDENEPMAKRGMGAIYSRTSVGDVLRARPDAALRQSLLDRWYWPHHAQLERMVNDVIARSGVCLIVDCHSFSSVPLPHEPDQTTPRPDFCIGTDPFHTPAAIRDAILTVIEG
jgi:hypothetical protein